MHDTYDAQQYIVDDDARIDGFNRGVNFAAHARSVPVVPSAGINFMLLGICSMS